VYNLQNGNNVSRKSPVEAKMQTVKIVALGTLLSVVEIVGYLLLRVLVGLTGITRASNIHGPFDRTQRSSWWADRSYSI
jgi:hypothetical protein